jgi:hypothetical protein
MGGGGVAQSCLFLTSAAPINQLRAIPLVLWPQDLLDAPPPIPSDNTLRTVLLLY